MSQVKNLLCSLACLAFVLPALAVEQWGTFELTLNGPADGNPFTDTSLTAYFTQGTNHLTATGFYDGNGHYCVRFMPVAVGTWHYLTRSNRRELDGQSGDFTATPPAPENHGPVRVAHTYHFAYADGTPYYELGTTCYAWIHQGQTLQAQTLQTLASAPFNKLRMCVFPKHYAWNTNDPTLYPFVGESRTNWDFTRFNPEFFRLLDRRVQALQKLGIEADIILFHPYDEGHWGFDRMSAAADDRYLHYVVARLSGYRNVWWSLANEWDFMKAKQESDFVRFGEIIAHDDPYHHLTSIHNGSLIFNNTLPWITHASIQNGLAVESVASAELYRDVYRKPVVYDEVKYEGNIPQRWGQLSPEEMVFRFWNGTIAGTYVGHGETYASPDNVIWWSKGGVLKGQSPARLTFLKKILATAPAEGIEPVDRWQSTQYGGQSGKYYLVYFGKQLPSVWSFILPKSKTTDGVTLTNGMRFRVDVLDTWNMTITPVPGVFVLKKTGDYQFADASGRSISLPGKPYLALRIQRLTE